MKVRLFGGLADHAGSSSVDCDLPPDATAGDVRAAVGDSYPRTVPWLDRVKIAVNHEVVADDAPVTAGDEVALLPPVAGGATDQNGMSTMISGLREPPLPVDETLAAIAAPTTGATVSFLGTVRDHSDATDEVVRLDYSAYDEMADKVMGEIVGEVTDRWPQVTGVAILHAVGELDVGAHTILVACSAPHRAEAFEACRHALEQTKGRVPIWKREHSPDGSARWVGFDED